MCFCENWNKLEEWELLHKLQGATVRHSSPILWSSPRQHLKLRDHRSMAPVHCTVCLFTSHLGLVPIALLSDRGACACTRQQRSGWESNPRPLHRQSDFQTTTQMIHRKISQSNVLLAMHIVSTADTKAGCLFSGAVEDEWLRMSFNIDTSDEIWSKMSQHNGPFSKYIHNKICIFMNHRQKQ